MRVGRMRVGRMRVGRRSLVLVHGGMLASQHLVALATALAADFDVVIPDRRGRGMSGPYRDDPHGAGSSPVVDQEAADIVAVVEAVGARDLFALSSGAVVSLHAALGTDAITKLALYEPPLSVDGSTPSQWMPRYERELAAGRTTAALITGMRGLRVDRVMSHVPHLAAPILDLMLRHEHVAPGDVAIRDLVPTWQYDIAIIRETADRLTRYAEVRADVLLMGGSRSPAFLGRALDELAAVLPASRRTTLTGLGHQAAVDQPDRVAAALREFLL